MAVRSEQKLKTRRALMDAALNLLSEDRGFSSISLREVAREAGIAPTSFYRHFHELEELGLALVDEAGLALRQLMRQARQRVKDNGSAVSTSVDTFMEFLNRNQNLFRLLLREKTGVSKQFRTAISAETDHFATELAEDLRRLSALRKKRLTDPRLVAEAMVTIVFNQCAEALDKSPKEQDILKEKLKKQLLIIILGAERVSSRKIKSKPR